MKTLPLTVSLLLVTGGLIRAQVEVVPVRLDETRTRILQDDHIGRNPAQLKVLLSVNGPEAEAAAKYGDLTIDEAVDDTGASLIPKADSLNEDKKFREYDNAFFRKSHFGNSKPAAPQIEITLSPAKRAATKITRLRGTVSLATTGTIVPVELAKLKSAGTKKLDIPTAANLTITVNVKSGDDARSVGIELTGDEGALESLTIVDANGNEISSGMSSFSINNGPAHRSLEAMQPLSDSMKLVAKLALDRKITKVPFDLKDIPLP